MPHGNNFGGFANGLSDRHFFRLSELIYAHAGINLPLPKKTLLEVRLKKRMKAIGMDSYEQYHDYVFSSEGMSDEVVHLIDAVATNTTHFFREPRHFDYLIKEAIPSLISIRKTSVGKLLHVWSAACSTGEEPYSLAMLLADYAENHPNFSFSILATDISTKVLKKAEAGVYDHDQIRSIPWIMRKKYLLKSSDPSLGLVKIGPELMRFVRFQRLNLMDNAFGIDEPMDVIFCRNVLIYFDQATQKRIIARLCDYLVPGGYLFMGHSEALGGLNNALASVSACVYRKKA